MADRRAEWDAFGDSRGCGGHLRLWQVRTNSYSFHSANPPEARELGFISLSSVLPPKTRNLIRCLASQTGLLPGSQWSLLAKFSVAGDSNQDCHIVRVMCDELMAKTSEPTMWESLKKRVTALWFKYVFYTPRESWPWHQPFSAVERLDLEEEAQAAGLRFELASQARQENEHLDVSSPVASSSSSSSSPRPLLPLDLNDLESYRLFKRLPYLVPMAHLQTSCAGPVKYDFWVVTLFVLLPALYGATYLFGIHANFGTVFERTLWLVATAYITAFGAYKQVFLYIRRAHPEHSTMHRVARALLSIAYWLYGLSTTYLAAESARQLFALPPEAFMVPQTLLYYLVGEPGCGSSSANSNVVG